MPRHVMFAAYTTDDDGRRRGLIGVFKTQPKADKAADGRGGWGSKGEVAQVAVLEADGKFWLLQSPEPITLDLDTIKDREDKIKAAKAKLTPEELELLGVEE